MHRIKLFLPVLIFIPLGLLLLKALELDPQELPSALMNKPVPDFQLQSLAQADRVLDSSALQGEKTLLNVWATWCPSCKVEHPYLMKLARQDGIRIVGLNYKDERRAALAWLARYKDPYAFNIYDPEGRLGLDLGVYGAPETFVLDSQGIIRYKHVGVVNERVWQNSIKPVLDNID